MSLPADQEHVSRFRQWIVSRLKESGWVQYAGEELEAVSKRLGLRPELLREAQQSLADDFRREGRQPRALDGRSRVGPRRRYEIVLPKTTHEDWQAYCQARDLTESTLLRSLIHHLLSRPEQPSWLGAYWLYRGRKLPICKQRAGKKGTGKWLTRVDTDITQGAHQALYQRAFNTNTKVPWLVRGVMIDLLEGRIKKLRVIGVSVQMWDDPQRYWTLEEKRESHG